MTYRDKLLDPRWQRLRLEVFQRDNWTCRYCWAPFPTRTLHVHHEQYLSPEPWETPKEFLKTACADCHKGKHGLCDRQVDDIPNKRAVMNAVRLGVLIGMLARRERTLRELLTVGLELEDLLQAANSDKRIAIKEGIVSLS